jgi:hypothetical protein
MNDVNIGNADGYVGFSFPEALNQRKSLMENNLTSLISILYLCGHVEMLILIFNSAGHQTKILF